MTSTGTWEEQHQAIKDLMDCLDRIIPTLTEDKTAGSVFMAAVALYRCNRLLRTINDAVMSGLGDTAGGNVRTLYDTWIFGHLLMLSELQDAINEWGMTREQAGKMLRAMDLEDKVKYPEEAPEEAKDIGTQQRAVALRKKLATEDPDNANMPEHCYDFVYRSESHFGSHVNLDVLSLYAVEDGKADGTIGVHAANKNCDHRIQLAAYITAYFASQVFKKAGVDMSEFNEIEKRLDPPKQEEQQ